MLHATYKRSGLSLSERIARKEKKTRLNRLIDWAFLAASMVGIAAILAYTIVGYFDPTMP